MKILFKIACTLPVVMALSTPINVSGSQATVASRAPLAQQGTFPAGADVFLVDDDLSNIQPSQCIDYDNIYSNTLQALGLSINYWETSQGQYTPPWLSAVSTNNTPLDTSPRPYYTPYELAYVNKLVIDYTGVSRCGRATGWNASDLQTYLNNGGRMLLFSQDALYYDNLYASGAYTNAASFDPPHYFGAQYVTDTIPVSSIQGEPTSNYLSDINYTIGQPNSSIDQMDVTSTVGGDSAVIFRNAGDMAQVVGTSMSSEPTIERVQSGTWQQLPYRTALMSFGLETLPSDSARAILLDRLVSFLLDDVNVSFSGAPLVAYVNSAVTLNAAATTSVTTTQTGFTNNIVQYRWDFGDGSPIETSAGPNISHTYTQTGVYKAYVEVTDRFGHKAVSSSDVSVGMLTSACVWTGYSDTLYFYIDQYSFGSVTIPSGAFSGRGCVNVTAGITGGLPTSGTLGILGSSFFIQSSNPLAAGQHITLTVYYAGSDVGRFVGSSLQLYLWQETSGPWSPVPDTLDTTNHQISAVLDHFSRYSVQGIFAPRAYLPIVMNGS